MDFNSKKKLPVVALCMLIGNTPQAFSLTTTLKGGVSVEVATPRQKELLTG